MNRRIFTAAMAVALSTFSVAPVFAQSLVAPASTSTTLTTTTPIASTKTAKVKLIKFDVRNDSALPLVIAAGGQQLTVKPGQTTSLRLQEGTQMIAVNGSTDIAPGSVLAQVSGNLDGNTLAVR